MSNTILAIDIGTTSISTVVAQSDANNKINILGVNVEASEGTNKGLITNLEVASTSIKDSIASATNGLNAKIDSTYVSISSAHTKGVISSGSVSIPNGQITQNEINQVLQMALYNATIVPDYDTLHTIPIYFKVDDSQQIDNPLNMNGQRLEVSVYIVTAKKSAINNIISAFKSSNYEITNFVLSGYASALSVLDEQQKKLGAAVLDIGGSTTDIICCKNNSVLFTDFLPVGSTHITNDLSRTLSTPTTAAETIKLKYGSLVPISEANSEIKKIEIPIIGDESSTKDMPIDHIQLIIHARVEEMLILAREKIKKSGIADGLTAGITITGGITFIDGIKELAQSVFEGYPIKIAKPFNIPNGMYSFEDPTLATIVGVLLYGLDPNPNFELDSNNKLRQKPIKRDVVNLEELQNAIGLEHEKLPQLTKKDKGGIFTRARNALGNMF